MISQPLTIIRANKMGKPYIQNSDPSLTNTMSQNDLWLNISEGTMKAWDGTGWVEMQFGESAIMDDCITNRMISNDISASKITAGILQSVDGSFYLNLETGEAELLNLIMGGQVEGNIIATSTNGLTRLRMRGREGTRNITAGLIFEQRENENEPWENAGQIYFGYSSRATFSVFQNYIIGTYNSNRPVMGYNSGSTNGVLWRAVSTDWLRDCKLTYHGVLMSKRDDIEDSFTPITPVLTAIGDVVTGTAVVGNGTVTCTYEPNNVMRLDFNIRITTSGSGEDTYGISTSLLRTINTEIPALTPVDGGVVQIYTSAGALKVGYIGATMKASGSYWMPYYVSSNALTAINESVITSGLSLVGTCYATFAFED